MVIKEIDRQGRIVIPKRWREEVLRGRRIIMVRRGSSIELRALEDIDLTEFFDSVEVDIKSDLSDWHSVRRELSRGRISRCAS